MKRVLILDAYDEAGRAGLTRAEARHAGGLYTRLFERCAELTGVRPDCTVSRYEGGFVVGGAPANPADFDAVVWTGSNLTVHKDTPAVRDQLAFCEATFQAGVPQFGSCWALQLAVVADGGACAVNPKGREFGVARKIRLNAAGRNHPMFEGRASGFDNFASHEDHAVAVGPNTTVLAGNSFSPIQAVEVIRHGAPFWAVQYHPEYELDDVARLMVARGPQLIEQGFLPNAGAVDQYVADFEAMQADPGRKDLAFKYGVDEDLTRLELRAGEFMAWVTSR